MATKDNKYENLVIHCESKEEWNWIFNHLPDGYTDKLEIQLQSHIYGSQTGIRLSNKVCYYSRIGYCHDTIEGIIDDGVIVKAIVSFQEYKDMFLEDQQIECNQYHVQSSKTNYKTLELLSKNIAAFTKATKLAGIEEKELDKYSKLLIELSAGGVELSWVFHTNIN